MFYLHKLYLTTNFLLAHAISIQQMIPLITFKNFDLGSSHLIALINPEIFKA
jgi:hypothetical protein